MYIICLVTANNVSITFIFLQYILKTNIMVVYFCAWALPRVFGKDSFISTIDFAWEIR